MIFFHFNSLLLTNFVFNRDRDLYELVSSALRDLTEAEFIDDRDESLQRNHSMAAMNKYREKERRNFVLFILKCNKIRSNQTVEIENIESITTLT